MTTMREARDLLIRALQQHAAARSEAEIEGSVLRLHTGLEEAFRAYLEHLGYADVDTRDASFPDLVDLIRDRTDLFQGDTSLPPLLGALNNTRIKIAHPRADKPSARQIANDADQLAKLTRRFWHGLFGEECPVPAGAPPPRPEIHALPPRVPTPPPPAPAAKPPPVRSPSKLGRFLTRLWKDESQPRFRIRLFLGQVAWAAVLLMLAWWCYFGALSLAGEPEPIKYAALALFLVGDGFFLWAIVTILRILGQLRLRGLLLVLGAGYLLSISILVFTSDRSLPFHEAAWLASQELAARVVAGVRDAGQALREAPGQFRSVYSANPSADSGLATVPAGPGAQVTPLNPSPATPGADGSSGPSLQPPNCPHPQARLTAPQIGQSIRGRVVAEGTADIEDFDYYKFEYRRADVEDSWHWIQTSETPVEAGVLGTWDVSSLSPGDYLLRLTVVDRSGNYPYAPCEVRVRIEG